MQARLRDRDRTRKAVRSRDMNCNCLAIVRHKLVVICSCYKILHNSRSTVVCIKIEYTLYYNYIYNNYINPFSFDSFIFFI